MEVQDSFEQRLKRLAARSAEATQAMSEQRDARASASFTSFNELNRMMPGIIQAVTRSVGREIFQRHPQPQGRRMEEGVDFVWEEAGEERLLSLTWVQPLSKPVGPKDFGYFQYRIGRKGKTGIASPPLDLTTINQASIEQAIETLIDPKPWSKGETPNVFPQARKLEGDTD